MSEEQAQLRRLYSLLTLTIIDKCIEKPETISDLDKDFPGIGNEIRRYIELEKQIDKVERERGL